MSIQNFANTVSQTCPLFSSRQKVLAYLLKLKGAIDANTQDLAEALTQRLCDTIVDYLSAGHFQVFAEHVPAAHQYVAIESTTRQAMAFNDRFGNGNRLDLAELSAALEHLAYLLDTRMELEDDLLAASYTASGRFAAA